jgi:hypothetical protein
MNLLSPGHWHGVGARASRASVSADSLLALRALIPDDFLESEFSDAVFTVKSL